ncbi:MAG: nitroreductase [Candidatus Altiarchaeota archaeon]|nr:nitroreductase [Candidatus Altiarchaeota archaeon]
MDLDDCIKNRRSVRDYLDKQVEKEKIDAILSAGAMAPSARDTQQWRFTVVEDRERIRMLSVEAKRNLGLIGKGLQLAEALKAREDTIFYNAPLLIIVSAKKDDKWAGIDCGLAAQNMMLKAYGLGLGSCYIGLANSLNKDSKILKDIGIPDDYAIISPLIFGYPVKWPEPKTRKPQVLKWIK